MKAREKDALSSTDRGCPLCQNTRPCGYMNPDLLEPPAEDIFEDEDEKQEEDEQKQSSSCSSRVGEHNVMGHNFQEEFEEDQDQSLLTEPITKDIFNDNEQNDHHHKSPCASNKTSSSSSCGGSKPCCESKKPEPCCGNGSNINCASSAASSSCNSTEPKPAKKSCCEKSKGPCCAKEPKADCGHSSCQGESKCKASSTSQQQRKRVARSFQNEQWMERYHELEDFYQQHGHSCVPTRYADKPGLGLWVKRQRHQYKILVEKDNSAVSTLTPERIKALNRVEFVWQVRDALWTERYSELKAYYNQFGNSDVPSKYPPNQALASWVKCQRHQQQLFSSGRLTTMTHERKAKLDNLSFQWRILGNQNTNGS